MDVIANFQEQRRAISGAAQDASQSNGPVALTRGAIGAHGTATLPLNAPSCPKEKVQI